MCAPKLRTPGMARSSLLARMVMRDMACSEVPGFSTQCIKKSYSLKLGRNSWPSSGTSSIDPTATPVSDQATRLGRASRPGSTRA